MLTFLSRLLCFLSFHRRVDGERHSWCGRKGCRWGITHAHG